MVAEGAYLRTVRSKLPGRISPRAFSPPGGPRTSTRPWRKLSSRLPQAHNDAATLGRYLDRLQHLAGSRPLILGEFGIDSIRSGQVQQAAAIEEHVSRVFHHGLAGSFVFSFTDDWFTGGHQINDWAFGVTR